MFSIYFLLFMILYYLSVKAVFILMMDHKEIQPQMQLHDWSKVTIQGTGVLSCLCQVLVVIMQHSM